MTLSITALAMNASAVLDRTHAIGERVPRTYQARQYVAHWLDTGIGSITKVRQHVAWLRQLPTANKESE